MQVMRDWRAWALMALIGLLISVSVRLVAEATSSDRQRIVAIEDRLDRLERSRHPSTTKRYTSDDAARDQARIAEELGAIKQRLDHLEATR